MLRASFKYCHATGTVLPINEARALDEIQEVNNDLANVAHGYIPDEMDATKHPITGEYYTSKAKFRAVTRAHGYDEVGTAYENGYNPEDNLKREWKGYMDGIKREYKERMN